MAYDTHQEIDLLDLEGHKLIADKLRANCHQILQQAQDGIMEYGHPVPGAWQEWLDKFDQLSLDELIDWFTQDNDEGQRIRQSSPLTFCLSSQERKDLIAQCTSLSSSH